MSRRYTFWPRSLFGRNLVLILSLVVISQLTTNVLFLQFVQKPRALELAAVTAAHVKALGASLLLLPPYAREAYMDKINAIETIKIKARPDPAATGEPLPVPALHYFMNALAARLGSDRDVIWQGSPRPVVWIRIPVGENAYWLRISGRRLQPLLSVLWLELSAVLAVLAMIGAFLIQRRLNRPLRELAGAAGRIGAGDYTRALPEDTPTEIAAVSRSFNAMARSLARADAQRGVMLAGISEDLRAPLTRLRLGLAMLNGAGEESLKASMTRQVQEIDTILQQFIDFALADSDEAVVTGDLNALIQELASEFTARGDLFKRDLDPLPPMRFRPAAMRRMLGNLMQNAVRHAGTGLEIRTRAAGEKVEISVLDRGPGPGLPAGELERLRQPFARLADVRNGSPGAGLGLAIADRIARLHGGELTLLPRAGGGLEARVLLPKPLPAPIGPEDTSRAGE